MRLDYVLILYRPESNIAKNEALECQKKFQSLGCKVHNSVIKNENSDLKKFLYKEKILPNIAVVLGGDGTVLRAAREVSIHGIPIICFNVGGNLGFLSHEKSLLTNINIFTKLYKDEFLIQPRMMLHANLKSYSSSNKKNKEDFSYWALNDFYFRSYRDEISPTCTLELEIDGEKVDEYRGDGLIISTPTGSTAYSMATGGPILHPGIDAIIVNPICPISLSSRPIVVPGESTLVVKPIGDQTRTVKLWQDGTSGALTAPNDQCIIKKAMHNAQMIVLKENPSYYSTLTQKLHWAGSLSNR